MFRDEYTGLVLPTDLVEKARKEEIGFMNKLGVWRPERRDRAKEGMAPGARPTGVRWIDSDQGDASLRSGRSRLVVQEMKRVSELGAPCILFYLALTLARPAGEEWVIVFIDVSMIYTHCENVRRIVIELPAEGRFSKDHVGVLVKYLDDQRDASQHGEMEVLEVLSEVGSAQRRKARTWKHGDDIATRMPRSGITSFIEGVGEQFLRERGFGGDRDVITWKADHEYVELLCDQGRPVTGSTTGVSQSWSSPSARSSKNVGMRALFLAAEVLKQLSDDNVADLGTKTLDGRRIQQLETLAGLSSRGGRHALAYRAAGKA